MMYTIEMISDGMIYTYQVSLRLKQAFKKCEGFASLIWKFVMLVFLIEGI
jgi:hypothetical protein